VSYPSERLAEEVAFVSHYMHWPLDQILAMEHPERQAWVAEVSRMNERLNQLAGRAR
jgi:hypothetical protein